MSGKLEIRPIMGSAVEDVLNFKTCCGARAYDQNLEILVTNRGEAPVVVPSRFELIGDFGTYMVETLIPHGDMEIMPGATIAFYCEMDEQRWRASDKMVFRDGEGGRHEVILGEST